MGDSGIRSLFSGSGLSGQGFEGALPVCRGSRALQVRVRGFRVLRFRLYRLRRSLGFIGLGFRILRFGLHGCGS